MAGCERPKGSKGNVDVQQSEGMLPVKAFTSVAHSSQCLLQQADPPTCHAF
jgi:hypothetical protein